MRRRADLLFVAAAILASATPAQAADRQSISIAPGRLGEAAIALGRQTGASIGMSDQALAGLALHQGCQAHQQQEGNLLDDQAQD